MAGYSGTPLAKKLGIKNGAKVMLINAPDYYTQLFTDMPAGVHFIDDADVEKDVIHFFTKQSNEYLTRLPQLIGQITQNGMIWVSWPKKSSKVPTDITEHIIRNFAIEIGLVDIKVCAVDQIWSGLKLVIPVKSRKSTR
ncbi:DUF3052 family protein [Mucilaginibacter sp. FT3.2]|uniref:DUF3052 family protein n=1 Tax=Mucilaginibacter sp. FT3.2 TaxID=2723090 RepID=UPI00160F61DD|nr:DUF3052 family protein [Mucilaginibacter sp. FT3.2]MBB6233544.1 hypothetical protein [Mucilaginibacter sp. FT3.2]